MSEEQHEVVNEPVNEDAAAEAARAQAEARRKRILEKAQTRMCVVNGEEGLGEEEKQESASKAARIRAARQRRYGKKKNVQATTEGKTEATAIEAVAAPPTATSTTADATAADTATATAATATVKEVVVEDAPHDEPPVQKDTLAPAPTPTAAPVVATTDEATTSTEPKKKYVGVARMRRNMIKKKKLEREEGGAAADTSDTATTDIPALATVNTLIFKPTVAKIPIYMHLVTVLLLFFAGLDVGLQQRHPDIQMDTTLSLLQHGLPWIHRPLSIDPRTSQSKLDHLMEEAAVNTGEALGDEFAAGGEDGEDDIEANIDPLFRMDLDELTKGPGVVSALGRVAVGIHRAIIGAVSMPLTILQSFLGIPQALWRSPPVLCVVALLLRQVVGKLVLGAALPPAETRDKGNSIELLSMAKNFVMNFLSTTFPTVVTLYDAFTHLRADMYVLLCGVFTGLVWVQSFHYQLRQQQQQQPGGGAETGTVGSDEL